MDKDIKPFDAAVISKKRVVEARLRKSHRPYNREAYIESRPEQKLVSIFNPTELARATLARFDIEVINICFKALFEEILTGYCPSEPMLELLKDCKQYSLDNNILILPCWSAFRYKCPADYGDSWSTEPVDYRCILEDATRFIRKQT